MQTQNVVIDEFGNQSQQLGDNSFQGAPVTIDIAHHEIHCGDMYVTTRTVDLANGASDVLHIVVPNETGTNLTMKKYHTLVSFESEAESEMSIYESPTTSNDGTPLTKINRERNSTFTSNLGIFHTPTSSIDGTIIYSKHIGNGVSIGGGGRSEEFVLKNNTKYLVRLTNFAAGANHISWEINHYINPGI
jgi:hypothetical protein